MSKSKKKSFRGIKLLVILLIIVAVIAGGVFGFIKYKESKNKMSLEQVVEISRDFEETEEETPEPESPINFDEIRKSNEDIVAWIEVPGTAIDYPILQSSEDMEEDFYLNHNLDGSGGLPGCIYIQKFQSPDFSDLATIVYGHNMKDGTMFRDLHKFEDLKFYEEHDEIIVYTPTDVKKYRIVAAVNYDDRLIPHSFNNFAEKKDLWDFLGSVSLQGNTVTNHQVVGEDIYQADQYIVLSTCTAKSDVRYLVIGEIIEGE